MIFCDPSTSTLKCSTKEIQKDCSARSLEMTSTELTCYCERMLQPPQKLLYTSAIAVLFWLCQVLDQQEHTQAWAHSQLTTHHLSTAHAHNPPGIYPLSMLRAPDILLGMLARAPDICAHQVCPAPLSHTALEHLCQSRDKGMHLCV